MINKCSDKHNQVKNRNWREADKRNREVELGATENIINQRCERDFKLGPTDFKSGALTTRPRCLLARLSTHLWMKQLLNMRLCERTIRFMKKSHQGSFYFQVPPITYTKQQQLQLCILATRIVSLCVTCNILHELCLVMFLYISGFSEHYLPKTCRKLQSNLPSTTFKGFSSSEALRWDRRLQRY